jgi:hypothetical protein
MTLEVEVRVTCPDDEESEAQQVEAVLRINETELALWCLYIHRGAECWVRRTFRPFRGPWPIQSYLTVFFAPTILFGKRDVRPICENGEMPCLRITPFVPPEFWVDIRFNSKDDLEAVADLVEKLFNPPSVSGNLTTHARLFFGRWWRVVGIPMLLFPMVISPAVGGPLLQWVRCGGFAFYVVTIMLVEACSYRREHPPRQGRSNVSTGTRT